MLEEDDYSIDMEDNYEEIFDTERYRRFHCYHSREDIVHSAEEHKAIAIFFSNQHLNFTVVLKRKVKKN